MKTERDAVTTPMLKGARLLLVTAPYYREIADHLERGARAAADAAEAIVDVITVPGAFEIPGVVALAARAQRYDAFVALGCVVRGETSHYDYVCGESARGLMELSLQGHAVGYGILTVDTIEQALVRADPAQGDKGGEAVRAALALASIRRAFAGTQ